MGISGVALFNIFQFLALEKHPLRMWSYLYIECNFNRIIFSIISKRKSKYTPNPIHDSFILRGYLRPIKGDFSLLFSLHFNSGDLWMIAAVCIWGIYSVCSKWATKQLHHLWQRCTLVFSALFYYYRLT